MRTSLNPLMYMSSKKFIYLEDSPTLEPVKLSLRPGEYYVAGRAGGGAGSSGAGGVGGFFEKDFKLTQSTNVLAYIGDGGKSYEEGGNGGKYEQEVPVQYTITILPDPEDAIVTLTATGISLPKNILDFGTVASSSIDEYYTGGTDFTQSNYFDLMPLRYTQEGNSITVSENTLVTYRVEKTNYETVNGSIIATEDKDIPVKLNIVDLRVTIDPSPKEANATTEFWEINGLFAWHLGDKTIYTKSIKPEVGDVVYDENEAPTKYVVIEYSEEKGIAISDIDLGFAYESVQKSIDDGNVYDSVTETIDLNN